MEAFVLIEIQMMIIFEFRFTELMGLRMIHLETSCRSLPAGEYGVTIAAESPAGRLLHPT
jgi:hypothetical protein